MLRLELQGVKQLSAKVKALGPNAQARFEHGMIAAMKKIMLRAQQLVPVYSNTLRASAFARAVKRNAHRTDWRFGYAAPYAQFVHEHPNAHTNADGHPCACYATIHRPRPGMLRNGQGYQWLKRAVVQQPIDVAAILAKVREAIAAIAAGQTAAERRPNAPEPPMADEGGGGGKGTSKGKRPKASQAPSGDDSRLRRNRLLIAAGLRNAGISRGGGGSMSAYLRELMKLAASGGRR